MKCCNNPKLWHAVVLFEVPCGNRRCVRIEGKKFDAIEEEKEA